MVYAQILDNTIVNTIELDDSSLLPLFQSDPDGNPYDSVVQIDSIVPQPGIGWWFDNVNWNAPEIPVPLTTVEEYTALVQAAMDFGQALTVQYATQNVMAGITQAGLTLAVLTYTTDLYNYLSTGSLYVAITEIGTMIADTSSAKVGAHASAIDTMDSPNITLTANTLGTKGNSITLIFDGASTISTIVGNWNTTNPTNQVSYSGSSEVVPAAQTIALSGGLPTLSPFVTNDILYAYMNQIEGYLGLPLTPNPGP